MNLNQQIERWLTDNKRTFSAGSSGVDHGAGNGCEDRRPFVTLCYAQSWDGSITTCAGESLALSGAESTRLTHQLRSMHDGILVGIGTVLADDPQLTVRQWAGPNPQPIVLDTHLRMPAGARLRHRAGKRCWVLTTEQGANAAGDDLEIITVPCNAGGRVCLRETLKLLWDKGITSLMVEGGATVITGFVKARLADALVVTVAPTLIGGYKALGDLGLMAGSPLPRITPLFTGQLHDDLIMWGNLQYRDKDVGVDLNTNQNVEHKTKDSLTL